MLKSLLRFIRLLMISFILLAITGCSLAMNLSPIVRNLAAQSLLEKPLPKPEFITAISPYPGATGTFIDEAPFMYIDGLFAKVICFHFNEGAEELWDDPNEIEKPADFWKHNLQLKLDGTIIPAADDQPFMSGLVEIKRIDSKGNVVRKYDPSVSTCFKVNLTKGIHVASISLQTKMRKHIYTWAFRVDRISQ